MRKRTAQAALCIYPSITSHSRDTYSSCPRTRPRVSRLCVHASTRYVSPLVRVRIARPGSLATHMERAMPKRPSRDVGESAGRHIEGSSLSRGILTARSILERSAGHVASVCSSSEPCGRPLEMKIASANLLRLFLRSFFQRFSRCSFRLFAATFDIAEKQDAACRFAVML